MARRTITAKTIADELGLDEQAPTVYAVPEPFATGFEDVDAAAGFEGRPVSYEQLVAWCARFGETPANCPKAFAALPEPSRPARPGYVWTMTGETRIAPLKPRRDVVDEDELAKRQAERLAAAELEAAQASKARLEQRLAELKAARAARTSDRVAA